jgi:putative ABC transport system ATP-binding protein
MIDVPTTGTYLFKDHEVSALNESKRTNFRKGNIGFIFQSFNLIDELNVFENVEMPLLYLKKSLKSRKHMVNEILETLNIGHRKKHYPQQLSGGQQQRVAIARAVVANPELILADEPTGNLDSKNGYEVMNLLTNLNKKGTTVVIVTHSEHDAGFTNRIVNLFDGQIVTEKIGRAAWTF